MPTNSPAPPAETVTLERIRDALAGGEFLFYLQPKISLRTGEISGAEALLRWRLPDGRVLGPGAFLHVAEQGGIMSEITAVMFPRLIDDIEHLRQIRPDIQVAYNVAASDLKAPIWSRCCGPSSAAAAWASATSRSRSPKPP